MSPLPLYQVDAFTSRLFAGNPAAVVLLEGEWPTDALLLDVARENNLSETAFVRMEGRGADEPSHRGGAHGRGAHGRGADAPPPTFPLRWFTPAVEVDLDGRGADAPPPTFPLRWFTPAVEVDLCGHATLAAAHVLFEHGHVSGDALRFESASGELPVRREGDLLVLDFPARPPEPAEVTSDLVRALGTEPVEAHRSRDLVALFRTRAEVEALEPDMARLAALDTFAVVATAPAAAAGAPPAAADARATAADTPATAADAPAARDDAGDTDDEAADAVHFVSRFFAPGAGVPEDPVTGSAHATLAPFWAGRLGRSELRALQLSRRGGELHCRVRGERVEIGGRAVQYLEGRIRIDRG